MIIDMNKMCQAAKIEIKERVCGVFMNVLRFE